MEIDDKDRYEQLGEAWRHVVIWREKLFAGYLTVLGALGYVILQNANDMRRSVMFIAGILLSIIFWLLEFRTRQMVNACQIAASRLEKEGGGCYTTMNKMREKSIRFLTYGFGISILTAGAIGLCVVGLLQSVPRLFQLNSVTLGLTLLVGALAALIVFVCSERIGSAQRRRDIEQVEAKGDAQKTNK